MLRYATIPTTASRAKAAAKPAPILFPSVHIIAPRIWLLGSTAVVAKALDCLENRQQVNHRLGDLGVQDLVHVPVVRHAADRCVRDGFGLGSKIALELSERESHRRSGGHQHPARCVRWRTPKQHAQVEDSEGPCPGTWRRPSTRKQGWEPS